MGLCEMFGHGDGGVTLVYPITAEVTSMGGKPMMHYFVCLEDLMHAMQDEMCSTIERTDRMIVPRGESPNFALNMFGKPVVIVCEFEDTREAALTIDAVFHMPVALVTMIQ